MFGMGKKKLTPDEQLNSMSVYFVGCSSNHYVTEHKSRQLQTHISIDPKVAYDMIIMFEVYGLVYAWVLSFKVIVGSNYDVISKMQHSYPVAATSYSKSNNGDIEQSILFLYDALKLAKSTIYQPSISDIDLDTYSNIGCLNGLDSGRVSDLITDSIRNTFKDTKVRNFMNGSMSTYLDDARMMFSNVKII